MDLWKQCEKLKEECNWIELSRTVSEDTLHWSGFPAITNEQKFFMDNDGFDAHTYNIIGQFGTHADAPNHFVKGGNSLDYFTPKDMLMPLCVIDKSKEAAKNADFMLCKSDILDWEKEYGKIPKGAFVALRTDWSKKTTQDEMENADEDGNSHYPGWSVEAIEFLVKECEIASIGHETSDTDPAVFSAKNGYLGETYILSQNRFQIELMINLDKCPNVGALIFCTFPKLKGATGFTARCFAICNK